MHKEARQVSDWVVLSVIELESVSQGKCHLGYVRSWKRLPEHQFGLFLPGDGAGPAFVEHLQARDAHSTNDSIDQSTAWGLDTLKSEQHCRRCPRPLRAYLFE